MVKLSKKSIQWQIISFITLIFIALIIFLLFIFKAELAQKHYNVYLKQQEILNTITPFVESLINDKAKLKETLLQLQNSNPNIAYILIEKDGNYYVHSLLHNKLEISYEVDKFTTRLFDTSYVLNVHYKKCTFPEHTFHLNVFILLGVTYLFIVLFIRYKFTIIENLKEKIKLYDNHGNINSENIIDQVNAIVFENKLYEKKFHELEEHFEEQLELKTASLINEIKNRKSAEINLEKSVAEKVLMLKEIHHRVKNNMAIITGLIRIQARKIDDEDIKEMFIDLQNRIKTMELIHTSLYRSEDFAQIDFNSYLIELIKYIKQATNQEMIDVQINCSNIHLNIEKAIACGQIINELVTNSFKYAFPSKENAKITINFTKEKELFYLEVKDNGIGLESRKKNKISIGMNLVNDLTKYQLKGDLEAFSNNGVHYKITFHDKKF